MNCDRIRAVFQWRKPDTMGLHPMWEEDVDALAVLEACRSKEISEWSVEDFDEYAQIFDVFTPELAIYNWGCLLFAMCQEGLSNSVAFRYSLMNIASANVSTPVHVWSKSSFCLTQDEKRCVLAFLASVKTREGGDYELVVAVSEAGKIIEGSKTI